MVVYVDGVIDAFDGSCWWKVEREEDMLRKVRFCRRPMADDTASELVAGE